MTDQINLGLVWANIGGVTPVTSLKYTDGWVAEIPTFQHFNYMLQGLDQNILHLAEEGVFSWQADITYKPGTRLERSGVFYTSKTTNTGQDPTLDTTHVNWATGWLFGSTFASLMEYDGVKIELEQRAANAFTGKDVTVINNMPMLALETVGATNNLALGNLSGNAVVLNLGQGSPDSRAFVLDNANTHRLFHEGHFPHVSEVVDAVEEAPSDGKYYSRRNDQWAEVTSTTVSETPPTPIAGLGQGWFNLTDGHFYIDINDGDSSQWVPATPPAIARPNAVEVDYTGAYTAQLGSTVDSAIDALYILATTP